MELKTKEATMAPWVGKSLLLLVCVLLVPVLAQARSFGAGAVLPDVRYVVLEFLPAILVRFIVFGIFFPFLCTCR